MSLDRTPRPQGFSRLRMALMTAIAAAGLHVPAQKSAAEEFPYRPYFVNEDTAPALDPTSSSKRELLLDAVQNENQTTIAFKALLRTPDIINRFFRLWSRISQIENSRELNARFNLFRSLLMYLDDAENITKEPASQAAERDARISSFLELFENGTSFEFLKKFVADTKQYQAEVAALADDPNNIVTSFTIAEGGQKTAEEIFSNMMPRLYDPSVLSKDFFEDPRRAEVLRYAAFADLSMLSTDIKNFEPQDQLESFLRLARMYESQGWISYRLFGESLETAMLPDLDFLSFEKTLDFLKNEFSDANPLSVVVISELFTQFYDLLHFKPQFQAFLRAPENRQKIKDRIQHAITFAQRLGRSQKFSREYLEMLRDVAHDNIEEDYKLWLSKK